MSFKWIIALLIGFIILGCENNNAQGVKNGENSASSGEQLAKPNDYRTGFSYTLGYDLGSRMRKDSLNPDVDYFIQGFKEAILGDSACLTQIERDSILRVFNDTMRSVQQRASMREQERLKKIGDENAAKNPEFLKQNASKPGWKTTKSGLQYRVVKEGSGQATDLNDIVEIHFKGTLLDGTEFDNTYARGQPVTFTPQGVVPGWREALLMMKPGSIYKFVIPPELAYKDQSAGKIPPNAILLFEIEMLRNLGPMENRPRIQDAERMPRN